MLIAGVNLYALAIVLNALLGLPQIWGIVLSAAVVLVYIGFGGLGSAIYGEVLQFFVILAGLIPLAIVAVRHVGGYSALTEKVSASALGPEGLHAWQGTGIGSVTNPIGANWISIVLGLGFVLSFGYWTTNFAEIQRALSAKDRSASQRTPLIAAFPKIFIPAITIIPGLVALVAIPNFGNENAGGLEYNDAIPALIGQLLPEGVLGIAITGLFASFMAGVAANVSSLNTVVTYDLLQPYLAKGRSDRYYLTAGRWVTVLGVVIAIFTALLASSFNNIMTYLQSLFGIFNAPIFATFILGMFWKRTTGWGGFSGLFTGVIAGHRGVRARRGRRRGLRLWHRGELLPGRSRVPRRHHRHRGRLARHGPARARAARRDRLRRARARRHRPDAAPAQGEGLVPQAGAARRGRAGHHRRPQRPLRLRPGAVMSEAAKSGPPRDEPGTPQTTIETESRMQRLFDLRYVIGALMGLYGVVLVIRGLLDGPDQLARAAGTEINLWTGIGLLVVAAIFLAWARVRPLGIDTIEEE